MTAALCRRVAPVRAEGSVVRHDLVQSISTEPDAAYDRVHPTESRIAAALTEPHTLFPCPCLESTRLSAEHISGTIGTLLSSFCDIGTQRSL